MRMRTSTVIHENNEILQQKLGQFSTVDIVFYQVEIHFQLNFRLSNEYAEFKISDQKYNKQLRVDADENLTWLIKTCVRKRLKFSQWGFVFRKSNMVDQVCAQKIEVQSFCMLWLYIMKLALF